MAESPVNRLMTPSGDARSAPSLPGRGRTTGVSVTGGLPRAAGLTNDAVINGRYRIVKHPNRWAVGSAYPALDLDRRESVVLVLPELSPDQGPGFLQRAWVEVERTRRLQDGHIVTLRDCGMLAEGLPFFVIRRVQGNSLLRTVTNTGAFQVEMALHVMERLLLHVSEAHACGVALGDIRPANIILTDCSEVVPSPPEPELVDMAFARGLFDGLMTLPEAPLAYRSPQIRAGQALAVSDDIYALGAVLHFMLTGKAPRVQAAEETGVIAVPTLAGPDLGLSAYFSKVLQTALAVRRIDRYPGVRPFLEAVKGLRELASLSDAARGVLQMADETSQVDGFESDPTQELGRELLEALAARNPSQAPQARRADPTQAFEPRPAEIVPLPALADDVMTSVMPDDTEQHPAIDADPPPIRGERSTSPWGAPELPPEPIEPSGARRPPLGGSPARRTTGALPPPRGAGESDDTATNLPAIRTRPPSVSFTMPSARPSLAVIPAGTRNTAEATHLLQAARDHENPFIFAPLVLDAEVRSVNAPPRTLEASPRATSPEASFWRGVVFAVVFIALALGLGYLLFRAPEAPPVPVGASVEYLPSASVSQPERVELFALPAPATVSGTAIAAVEPPPTETALPLAPESAPAAPADSKAALDALPVAPESAPTAPADSKAALDAPPVAPESAQTAPADSKPALDAPVAKPATINVVLHLKPANGRIYRAKTGGLLCAASPCRVTLPRLGRGSLLKIRLVAPGLPDETGYVSLERDGSHTFAMTGRAARPPTPRARAEVGRGGASSAPPPAPVAEGPPGVDPPPPPTAAPPPAPVPIPELIQPL